MLKKSFVGILVIAALAILVFGVTSTGAWFTDTGSIVGNSVSTGSLDLEITYAPEHFAISYLEPGAPAREAGRFCIKNIGDYNMRVRGWIQNEVDPNNLSNYIMVQMIQNPTGLVGMYGPPQTDLWDEPVPFNSLLGRNTYLDMDDVDTPFAPQYQICYAMMVSLSSSAPNSVQASTITADIFLEAEQFNKPLP